MMLVSASILSTVLLSSLVAGAQDHFSEELLVTPLASGHLSVLFKFTTRTPGDIRAAGSWAHYDLVSRPLGSLLAEYRVQELQLALTQGVWRTQAWGYPVTSAPPGASVAILTFNTAAQLESRLVTLASHIILGSISRWSNI